MLGKGGKVEATGSRGIAVDADEQAECVHLTPCGFLAREIPDEADWEGVFNPPSVCRSYPVSEHPGVSFLARHFLQ
jgi:hypothetical protein